MDPVSTAAIGWGFSAAGWLISPLLTRFLNKWIDALGIDSPFKFRRQKKLKKKVKKLETTLLPQLLILTEAAQQSPYRDLLEKWLLELKSAFYEAEDVFGLVEYARLEKLDAEEEYFSQQECEVLQYLSSLEEIHFFDCKMRSLPNLQCLQSLRCLEICRCPNITSLSELPPSVEELIISDCNEEFTRRCNDANDPNWHKISHIPDKYIFL